MKTTEVLVEHFVGGILMTAALLFLIWSFASDQIPKLPDDLPAKLKEYAAIIAAVLAAVVYSIGLLAEFAARVTFDRFSMDRIKRRRLAKYVHDNKDNLAKSPILKRFAKGVVGTDEIDAYGPMRFVVMMRSGEALYREVEAQINRLRLVRVLFFVEAVVLIGLLVLLLRSPSSALGLGCLTLIALLILNFRAIDYRCNMYCRAIERSYRPLVLDP
jgi:heme A synthase